MKSDYTDGEILDLLARNPDVGVEALFRKYYATMCKAAYRIIPNSATVEDMVQELFLDMWRKRGRTNINTSLPAYLRRATVNRCLNFIRDQKITFSDNELAIEQEAESAYVNRKMEADDLQKLIDAAVDELPEKCRLVFTLSRFEELSYKEIAEKLNISPKTVENQISKALRMLKARLEPYMSGGLLLWIVQHIF